MLTEPLLTPTGRSTADDVSAHNLLNCLLRELPGPALELALEPERAWFTLPRTGTQLRVGLRRWSPAGLHRFHGPVSVHERGTGWRDLDAVGVAELIGAELQQLTGVANAALPGEVEASRGLMARFWAVDEAPAGDPLTAYLASEQALARGHRHHPAPKARISPAGDVLRYAPETGARFRLRFLAVRAGLVAQDALGPADLARLDRLAAGLDVPAGMVALPVHPWQWELTATDPDVRAAVVAGDLFDLGEHGPEVVATSSVRTVHHPVQDVFLKFGLPVRITNCVRTLEPVHLTSAVVLSRVLGPVLADLRARHPGTDLLLEPAQRHVTVGSTTYGVLLREGLSGRLGGGTPLLAAAVADEHGSAPSRVAALLGPDAPADRVLDWWQRYLRLLVPPVLDAYFRHGLVLEAHAQNAVVVVDDAGRPARMLLRDLEGAWLVDGGPAQRAAELPPALRSHLLHPAEQGWLRVAYCLFVNHLAEVAAALADVRPALEPALWARVHRLLHEYAETAGHPRPLGELLAGGPLPAKANLTLRWRQAEDPAAQYVPWPSPIRPAPR